jgi:3-oxoadipate enol-lactonase
MSAGAVELNGALCHFRMEGERGRPAVLLSNSLGTDYTMWREQAQALSRDFLVIRYDTRGHGGSGSPPGPYTIDLLGNDVLALLDHLDIARAHVVGLSMGGMIAQWLGIHAAYRVNRLVLANTAGRIGTEEGWRSRAAAVRADGLAAIAESSPVRWFTPAFVSNPIVEAMQHTLRSQSPEGYAACCDALAFADLRDGVAAIASPTLVIAGAADPVTTVRTARPCAVASVTAVWPCCQPRTCRPSKYQPASRPR